MKQKVSHRIASAIIETTFGKQSWLTGVHPLHKSPCRFCPAMVRERDMQDHLETFHMEERDRLNDDNEASRALEPLFPEEHDDEKSSQSESQAYRAAN